MDARQKAVALIEVERDQSAKAICEIMRAWGVRLPPNHVPESLRNELTRLAYACLDLGNDYAHDKETIPHTVPPSEPPSGAFGKTQRPPSVPRTPAIEPKRPPRDRSKR